MPKPVSVSDLNSNYEENIQRWARELSKSTRRLAVFKALYAGRKQAKTVSEIARAAGLPEQAVRDAGHQLRGLGLCGHEENNRKGERGFLYTKLPHIAAIRDRIVRLAKNPSRLETLPTKRGVGGGELAIFTKRPKRQSTPAVRAAKASPRLRIAFLSTNPDGDLRTDMEVRDVQFAMRRTNLRDSVSIRHVPAARLSDLLSELNEFRPTVIHFSGHAGGGTVVFEDETARSGGAVIDYSLVATFLEATDAPPKLLVLNGCDTYAGADVFLTSVDVVVAMLDSINDSAAGYFATQFYSAIGNGQSLRSALEQGKAVLKAGGFQDAELPVALARQNISLRDYILT